MKVYHRITNIILEKLQQGTVPWHKPWSDGNWPLNLVSKRPYRGINVFLLTVYGYSSPYWLTFKQAIQLGGNIKKNEHGTPIVYWKILDIIDEEQIEKQIPFLRYYTVFNVLQCEGIKVPENPNNNTQFQPLEQCESIIGNMPNRPIIEFDSIRAYYDSLIDKIKMPSGELFKSTEELYCTLFHEMVHSTGHQSRLNRKTVSDATLFGKTNYSKEKLIAEMGSAYLCGYSGIENQTIDNSAAYITGWLKKLKNDRKLVILAAAQAQKAFEYIFKTEK